jgi:hypothetical protein
MHFMLVKHSTGSVGLVDTAESKWLADTASIGQKLHQ